MKIAALFRVMLKTRSLIRRGITGLLILLVSGVLLPVTSEFFIELAKEQKFYDQPSAKVANAMNWLASATDNWWFVFILGATVGGSAFMWVDYFLRRRELSRDRPPSKTFYQQEYRNQIVEIDDKAFVQCTFDTVTLHYDGGVFKFDECKFKNTQKCQISSASTAVQQTLELMRLFKVPGDKISIKKYSPEQAESVLGKPFEPKP